MARKRVKSKVRSTKYIVDKIMIENNLDDYDIIGVKDEGKNICVITKNRGILRRSKSE